MRIPNKDKKIPNIDDDDDDEVSELETNERKKERTRYIHGG